MVKLWTVISTLAVTAGVVQGASLTARESCVNNDYGHLKCETSGGSPLVSDCEAAINDLADDNLCYQGNGHKSHCTTIKHHGTCKIDVCGQAESALFRPNTGHGTTPSTGCKHYLRNLLHDCKSGNVVGGQIFPQKCSVDYYVGYDNYAVEDPEYKNPNRYHVQFSHSS